MSTLKIGPYLEMISDFVSGRISASEFEIAYLERFKNESSILPEQAFLILDGLFADVDAYCADPELRDADELDEEQLRDRCKLALEKLEE